MHFPSSATGIDLFPSSRFTSDCTDLYLLYGSSHLLGMDCKHHIVCVSMQEESCQGTETEAEQQSENGSYAVKLMLKWKREGQHA